MPKGRWTLPFSDGHASLGFLLYSFWPFRPQVMDPVTKLKLLFLCDTFYRFFSFFLWHFQIDNGRWLQKTEYVFDWIGKECSESLSSEKWNVQIKSQFSFAKSSLFDNTATLPEAFCVPWSPVQGPLTLRRSSQVLFKSLPISSWEKIKAVHTTGINPFATFQRELRAFQIFNVMCPIYNHHLEDSLIQQIFPLFLGSEFHSHSVGWPKKLFALKTVKAPRNMLNAH